eukprot:7384882-Prymnesium_polylepis.1
MDLISAEDGAPSQRRPMRARARAQERERRASACCTHAAHTPRAHSSSSMGTDPGCRRARSRLRRDGAGTARGADRVSARVRRRALLDGHLLPAAWRLHPAPRPPAHDRALEAALRVAACHVARHAARRGEQPAARGLVALRPRARGAQAAPVRGPLAKNGRGAVRHAAPRPVGGQHPRV